VVELEVTDEFQAWVLIDVVFLGSFELLLEYLHDFLALLGSQVLNLLNAHRVSELLKQRFDIESFLAELVNKKVNILKPLLSKDFFLHQAEYGQSESKNNADPLDEEQIPNHEVYILGQIDRKQAGDPLKSNQVQTELHVVQVLTKAWQSLQHEVL